MDSWGNTLSYISWDVWASYKLNLKERPGKYILGRYMISNLSSIVDWKVITTRKQQQVDIDNALENTTKVRHNYAVDNIVFVDKDGIYLKLHHNKHGPYISA